MDLNALMQAASQDPSAAQFIQQLLSGGGSMMSRMPEIQRQELHAPDIQPMESAAPLPVFEPVKSRVDELLAKWSPPTPQAGVDPSTFAQPTDMLGAMGQPPAGAGAPAEGIPPQGDITQTTLPPPGGDPMQGPLTAEQAAQFGQGTLPPDLLSQMLGGFLG